MKKGFTLIEVIAVIVILGIIGLIAVPISNNITKRSKEKLYNEQIDKIINACKNYILENDDADPDQNYTRYVLIEDLKDAGYLGKERLINPKTNKEIEGSIQVTYTNGKYTYEYAGDVSRYYATVIDDPYGVIPTVNQTVTTRPTSGGYIKYQYDGTNLTNPSACFYDTDLQEEFCIKLRTYSQMQADLYTLMGYDESWPNGCDPNSSKCCYSFTGGNKTSKSCAYGNYGLHVYDDNSLQSTGVIEGNLTKGCYIYSSGAVYCWLDD